MNKLLLSSFLLPLAACGLPPAQIMTEGVSRKDERTEIHREAVVEDKKDSVAEDKPSAGKEEPDHNGDDSRSSDSNGDNSDDGDRKGHR